MLGNELAGQDDHSGRLIGAIAQTLHNSHYNLIVTPDLDYEDRLIPIRQMVENRSVDAVILSQVETEDARVEYLLAQNFPFVTFGRSKRAQEHPYFDFDNESFGIVAAQSLLRRGRKSFLLVPPPEKLSYRYHLIAGLQQILGKTGQELELLKGVDSHQSNEDICDALVHRFKRTDRDLVDAVIVPSTSAAIATVMAIEKVGRHVGEDIDLYAKEPSPFLQIFRAGIFTVQDDPATAGRFLAEAVVQAIKNPESSPMQAIRKMQNP
ncbi:substrate-binding domain-containing protein [uncultured Cohaesibacter sp.]|uniref:substrate-binding domain-containing protein n=1 Tax=uncultured Cohaesibacter sp. TaxID=1002546 RepID=UPI00292FCC95|nr:substrate-binding domain-containing protein [uncultured Cohaesibacter sp.]